MTSNRVLPVIALLALLSAGAATPPPPVAPVGAKDPIKDAGLTKGVAAYVLPDEAAVLDAVKALRTAKAAADREVRARQVLDNNIAAKRKLIDDTGKEWDGLNDRKAAVANPEIRNRMILRMNRLVADQKAAIQALKDLEEQAAKSTPAAKTAFVDELAALTPKADALAARYAALADDAAVKAAITRVNAVANPKLPLGPSPELAAALTEVKGWQSAVESEAIPLREEVGTFTADVLLNGQPFQMSVDTGASSVSLPYETAEKLGMIPGPKDPTIQLRIANGQLITGREMTLDSVRVGRFTVKGVRCVVLQKGLKHAPLLLGGSFLNHFVVKLDPGKHELHLTELNPTAGKTSATKPAAASAAPAR